MGIQRHVYLLFSAKTQEKVQIQAWNIERV
jgi:hypothetical protein